MSVPPMAVRAHSYGGPEVMVMEPVTVGPPGEGEVRLRQTVIGVNFLDIHHRRGEAKPAAGLPFVNGFEAAGIIEAVGEGVGPEFRTGMRVGYTLALGAYATHRNAPAGRLVALPDSLDDQSAAALLLKGTTAEYLVRRLYKVGPDDVVLVHAAAGGVGLLVTQWAKALGATVVGTVGSPEKAELARSHGRCDHVVAMTSPDMDFTIPVSAAVGNNAVSVVYDGVAGPAFGKSLDLLRPGGVAIVLGNAGGKASPIDVHALKAKSLTVTSPSLPHFTGQPDDYHDSVAAVFRAHAAGEIAPLLRHAYPLSEAARAHSDIEARRTAGSVTLTA